MKRSRLLLATVLISAVACASTDTISGPAKTPGVAAAPVVRTIVGSPYTANGSLWLRSDSGQFRLAGWPATPLVDLIGAQVEVTGTDDPTHFFVVDRFTVLMVNGMPAADGILETTTDGYGLRMLDGSMRGLVDPPEALLLCVGKRVWVAGPADAAPVAFGLLI